MTIPLGKCPGCKAMVNQVRIEGIDAVENFQPRWKAVSYCCPYCNVVLGVQMDPIALKADLVTDLLDALRRRG